MDPSSATPASDAWSIGALASWFTAITRRQTPTSAGGRYWWQLIDGTMRMEPSARWKVTQIAAHLVEELPAIPILVPAVRDAEQCARCGSVAGLDRAGRCTACGYFSPY